MDQCAHFSTSDATWNVLAINPTTGAVTGYASLAALNAAGARAFPAFDPGVQATSLLLQTVTSANTTLIGAGALFVVNRGAEFSSLANDAARDAIATEIPTGVIVSWPGSDRIHNTIISNLWVRKTTAGDVFIATAITG